MAECKIQRHVSPINGIQWVATGASFSYEAQQNDVFIISNASRHAVIFIDSDSTIVAFIQSNMGSSSYSMSNSQFTFTNGSDRALYVRKMSLG